MCHIALAMNAKKLGTARIRTGDLLFTRQALCQLSHGATYQLWQGEILYFVKL